MSDPLDGSEIIADRRFPDFISENPIFRRFKTFDKIFPHIGLENCQQSIQPASALNLPFTIGHSIKTIPASSIAKEKLSHRALDQLICLPLATFIKLCHGAQYKRFCRENQDLSVSFSSRGLSGAWDLATMSMRGIDSCQHWNASPALQLVGSITDPSCGIIYLSNKETTAHGSRMVARAVVRYVFRSYTGPSLFLERLYLSKSRQLDIPNAIIQHLFASLLYQKTKLPVIYGLFIEDENVRALYSIPQTPVIAEAETLGVQSYRDSRIPYKAFDYRLSERYPQLQKFRERFINRVHKNV